MTQASLRGINWRVWRRKKLNINTYRQKAFLHQICTFFKHGIRQYWYMLAARLRGTLWKLFTSTDNSNLFFPLNLVEQTLSASSSCRYGISWTGRRLKTWCSTRVLKSCKTQTVFLINVYSWLSNQLARGRGYSQLSSTQMKPPTNLHSIRNGVNKTTWRIPFGMPFYSMTQTRNRDYKQNIMQWELSYSCRQHAIIFKLTVVCI